MGAALVIVLWFLTVALGVMAAGQIMTPRDLGPIWPALHSTPEGWFNPRYWATDPDNTSMDRVIEAQPLPAGTRSYSTRDLMGRRI